MPREQLDVRSALPQRRKIDPEDAEAEVEIRPQAAVRDRGLRIHVRRGDDAHVEGDVVLAADSLQSLRLERPEELHLEVDRHLGDLVQEQRSAAGPLEVSQVSLHRAREAPALVSEQLALDHARRNRSRVDRDEGAVAPRR